MRDIEMELLEVEEKIGELNVRREELLEQAIFCPKCKGFIAKEDGTISTSPEIDNDMMFLVDYWSCPNCGTLVEVYRKELSYRSQDG